MITLRTMGLAYLEENNLPKAERTFKKLITISHSEALGYANLGLVYIRMGNFIEAEKNLYKALEIVPVDPEIQLNLAEILIITNRENRAVELLEETLRFHPDHIKTLFKLGQIYSKSDDQTIRLRGEKLLTKVVQFLPANITARFDLIDLLLRLDKTEIALSYFEQIEKQMPEFPDDANKHYDQALRMMAEDIASNAIVPFNIFRNMLKPTPLYRFGFDELKGMGGPLIGTPVISFRQDFNVSGLSSTNVLESMRFTDVSESAGLNVLPVLRDSLKGEQNGAYIMALADFDGNGNWDLYVSGLDEKNNKPVRYLLHNNLGRFVDITPEAGIGHRGEDRSALFVDYDNDGYLDLYIVNTTANVLYYHYEPKKFLNLAGSAGISGSGSGLSACFADFDHDGDLDLYQLNSDKNRFYRNNLDGSFTEQSQVMNISGKITPSVDAKYADFDDDGDLDLFVLNALAPSVLYSNLRQGQFADVAEEYGLNTLGGSFASAMGDYNNDGLQDLIVFPADSGTFHLYSNMNGKKFKLDLRSKHMESILKNFICKDVSFFDFDNDGFLDLAVAGKPREKNNINGGILLFRNDGNGTFTDASHLLPENLPAARQIELADYNEDGDLDIFLSGNDGRIHLLRNDGGNANHYLKVQLVGLRSGSGKNNYFGIGTKVEVKSGDLYQSRIVSKHESHFGLGQRTKADVVRVLWSNGVPQNLFEPGSNQALLERQILKGSCPFLYAWNGQKYEFVTDVLWRSALGMPLGIMGGETAYAFSDPAEDYYKIAGDLLKEKDGEYSLQLTAELWETAYFNQVKLMVVDHPENTDIYVDERFSPPPIPQLKIHKVQQKRSPKSIIDDSGNNLFPLAFAKDNKYVSQMRMDAYQGITKLHDIIIELEEFPETSEVVLYLNGWVYPTDASINMAVSQSSEINVLPPTLQVKNKGGDWQTVIDNTGFPMGKNKYVVLDLTGKFLSADHKIRIRTNMHIYWDYIFYTVGTQDVPIQMHELVMETADIHYRGFSKMYRKGVRYGPFWFDYYDVTTDPLWRDLEGYYTRYGDVLELLIDADSKYVITNAGDEISLAFDAGTIPDVKTGWKRDFLIYTNGWLKDGDLNTASGQRVEPLPFIGMSKYPYGKDEIYPQQEEYLLYMKKYNTRKISTNKFRKLLSDNKHELF